MLFCYFNQIQWIFILIVNIWIFNDLFLIVTSSIDQIQSIFIEIINFYSINFELFIHFHINRQFFFNE